MFSRCLGPGPHNEPLEEWSWYPHGERSKCRSNDLVRHAMCTSYVTRLILFFFYKPNRLASLKNTQVLTDKWTNKKGVWFNPVINLFFWDSFTISEISNITRVLRWFNMWFLVLLKVLLHGYELVIISLHKMKSKYNLRFTITLQPKENNKKNLWLKFTFLLNNRLLRII